MSSKSSKQRQRRKQKQKQKKAPGAALVHGAGPESTHVEGSAGARIPDPSPDSSLRRVGTLSGHTDAVLSVATLPSEHLIASSSEDGTVRCWDDRTHKAVRMIRLGDSTTAVPSVCFHPGTGRLYSCAENKVSMFDLRSTDRIIMDAELAVHTWDHHTDEVNQLSLSANGNYLASCDDDGFLSVIHTKSLSVHSYQKAHENVCTSVAFDPNSNQRVFTGGTDSTVNQWAVSERSQTQHIDLSEEGQMGAAINPPFVTALAVHPHEPVLGVARADYSASIHQISGSGAILHHLTEQHTNMVSAIVFPTFDPQLILTGGADRTLSLWRVEPRMIPIQRGSSRARGGLSGGARSRKTVPTRITATRVQLKDKINALGVGERAIYVGDTSPQIHVVECK